MKVEQLVNIIGSDFYTGVPDSQLKALCDYMMDKYMHDSEVPDLLYAPIKEYNLFSAPYGCNLKSDKTYWTETFELDCDMKLNIRGMNSCIISNHMDHQCLDGVRKMLVGQSQIPSYEEDTVWVLLCHHPIEFWRFAEELTSRLDKRVDIQLYGHKHEQIIDKNEERLIISAGATQPVRGKDWIPRYNWITFQCIKDGNDRLIKVKVFPRKLSDDRDRFISDVDNCDAGAEYFEYVLNVDDKRRKNLCDSQKKLERMVENTKEVSRSIRMIHRKILYHFFELSYVQQTDILSDLDLIRDEYQGKRYVEVIEEILEDAEKKACLERLHSLVMNVVNNI